MGELERDVDAGIAARDPMPDIELQDEAPASPPEQGGKARPAATRGPALLRMFQAEHDSQAGLVRGPIKVPLVDPATGAAADAIVYYRRLTRDQRKALQEVSKELTAAGGDADDLNWAVFIERALDEDGHKLLGGFSPEAAREGGFNDDAVSEAVYQMSIGSRSVLTEEDLGNSSRTTPG